MTINTYAIRESKIGKYKPLGADIIPMVHLPKYLRPRKGTEPASTSSALKSLNELEGAGIGHEDIDLEAW